MRITSANVASVLQVAPMALILSALVIVPLCMIVAVSFMDYSFAQVIRPSSGTITAIYSVRP